MSSSSGGRGLARILAFLALLGAVLAPIVAALSWAWVVWYPDLGGMRSVTAVTSSIDLGWLEDTRLVSVPGGLAGLAIVALAAIPAVVALLSLRRTFLESAEGRPFSIRSVTAFRRFAWASLAAALVGWLKGAVMSPAVTALSPELQNQLVVSLSNKQVEEFFWAFVLIALAHVFVEGRRMSEDVEGLL